VASPKVMHSSESNEHYTPPEVVEAARYTLGGEIDLDPASCALANTVVKARCFMAEGSLDRDWTGPDGEPATVWLNPPGGKSDFTTLEPLPRDAEGKQHGPGLSTSAVWWWKLLYEIRAGHVKAAVFEAFSLDMFQAAQNPKGEDAARTPPHLFPLCVPASRLRHWGPSKPVGKGGSSQPSAIVLVTPERLGMGAPFSDAAFDARFREAFAPFGAVRL
jgi:hypothetical protein